MNAAFRAAKAKTMGVGFELPKQLKAEDVKREASKSSYKFRPTHGRQIGSRCRQGMNLTVKFVVPFVVRTSGSIKSESRKCP